MREAHILASNLGIKEIIFESDNQQLITICKKSDTQWQIDPVMRRIEELQQKFDKVIYSWCKRESNGVADEIARLNKNFQLTHLWTLCPPETLHQKIQEDRDSSLQCIGRT